MWKGVFFNRMKMTQLWQVLRHCFVSRQYCHCIGLELALTVLNPRPPAVWHESQVCYHSATQSSQFDVSFPEKLLKFVNFVATRGKIFSLKFTKYRLAAGLCPDPLGVLKRSPRLPAAIRGPTSKGRGGKGKGGGWKGRGTPQLISKN